MILARALLKRPEHVELVQKLKTFVEKNLAGNAWR
jgi:hypothetical protein